MCKESIPYAQALRLRRICSRLDWFNHRAADLCRFLVARGYKKSFVLKQIRRARLKTREETLAPRPRDATNRVRPVRARVCLSFFVARASFHICSLSCKNGV